MSAGQAKFAGLPGRAARFFRDISPPNRSFFDYAGDLPVEPRRKPPK
jgi:hypothetical protein